MAVPLRGQIECSVADQVGVLDHIFDPVDLYAELEVCRRDVYAWSPLLVRVTTGDTESASIGLEVQSIVEQGSREPGIIDVSEIVWNGKTHEHWTRRHHTIRGEVEGTERTRSDTCHQVVSVRHQRTISSHDAIHLELVIQIVSQIT